MRWPRLDMRAAIAVSVLIHFLLVASFVEISRERQVALGEAVELARPAEMPPVEVEILADPRAGSAEGEEETPQDAGATMASSAAATEPAPAPPADTSDPPPEPEQADTAEISPPASAPTTPSIPTPAAVAELPPPPPPPLPSQAPTPAQSPAQSPTQAAKPPPPTPNRQAAVAPTRPAPPLRLRLGSAEEGRPDGTTDIVLGPNTVPAGADPSQYNVPPRYPREAAQRGQQGVVRLSVLVATDGKALSVEVAHSSGFPLLDRAAREAVTQWRFRPAMEGGLTVPSTIPVTLSFVLEDRR